MIHRPEGAIPFSVSVSVPPRPYRTWGYPVVPLLFLIVTGWLLLNSLVATPRQALAGLPFYWYWSRRNKEAGN